ncbi:MAG: exodeoxyribonuclease V subunit gamma [Candidatus Binataceae bacterium]|nr:exodeoxyribonuclease V subunit gamma [Candidatus Binataceae bacterium]
MGIRLHYANRPEALVPPLAELVARQQRRQPLERVQIVVPNRIVQDWLTLRLSERIGVAANLAFPFLRNYLGEIVARTDSKIKILDADHLQMVLFECMRSLPADGPEAINEVNRYARAGADDRAELRLFQLAKQIAELFREYSISRITMVRGWRDKSAARSLNEAERWQRKLWLRIFAPDGALDAQWVRDQEFRWMLLPEAFEALTASQLEPIASDVMHVFGVGYAGPAFIRMFEKLGASMNVFIYALNPCMEFWEDLQNTAGMAREAWPRRGHKSPAGLAGDDPFKLDMPGDNPALRWWGRPAREYIRLLNELTDCDFDPHFIPRAPSPRDDAPLLARLQDDILMRVPERQPILAAAQAATDDKSIRFFACAGIRREIEIAANQIWSIIREPSQPEPLRFHQIAVIVPDSAYEDYLPQIEAVFSDLHQIPIEVVSRPLASESRVAEAIDLLLQLPLGRFTRQEMLRLLTHPAIAGEEDVDVARWTSWCEALGVFFGADDSDLEGTYLQGKHLFHWDQALKRLALGLFMTGERSGDARFFNASGDPAYLPYELAQDEIASAAKFIRLARGLLNAAIELRRSRRTLEEWVRVLSDFILGYVRTQTPADERIRDRCIAMIESMAAPGIAAAEVSYEIACDSAQARISGIDSHSGGLAERGVTIGPLSALRSIPFRTIFLPGLNETDFPERPRRDPIDLRLIKRQPGDVTRSERDRHLILETILAARERLHISYVARDQITGEPLEPSVVVRELQSILRGYLSSQQVEGLTVTPPASPYDLKYFGDLVGKPASDPEPPNFDPRARDAARMSALRANLQEHCGALVLPDRDQPITEFLSNGVKESLRRALRLIDPPPPAHAEKPVELGLSIAALRRFLECPLQGTARYLLRMKDEDEAGQDYQDEPLAQSRLHRIILMRSAFWTGRGDENRMREAYGSGMRIAQAHGQAPVGTFAAASTPADGVLLRGWNNQAHSAEVADLAEWQEVRVGRADEFAQAGRIVNEIKLTVEVPRSGGGYTQWKVKIHGNAGWFSPNLDQTIKCILRDEAKPVDFLGLSLSAIVLKAAGATRAKILQALVICDGNRFESRVVELPDAAQSSAYLTTLVADLLSGKNHYFLPIEAVGNILSKGNSGEIDHLGEIEKIRENDWSHCSSDYGPVRNPRNFKPPSREEIVSIIARRFAMMEGIFKQKKNRQ